MEDDYKKFADVGIKYLELKRQRILATGKIRRRPKDKNEIWG